MRPQQQTQLQGSSSYSIISACLTSMIGGAILIYPLLYKEYGILTVQITFSILALISYKTCTLILLHCSTKEDDFGLVVARQLSPIVFVLHSISGTINQVLMCLVYYMLFVNVGYKQLEFIASHLGYTVLSKDLFSLEQFSFQYFNLPAISLLLLLLLIKDLNVILKMASIAFLGIMIYVLFCLWLAIENIINQQQQHIRIASNLNWSTWNLEVVIGSLAQSLLLHNQVSVVFNSAANPATNLRDIRLVFLFGYSSYSIIGIAGYLGIFNRHPIVSQQNTILDFISSDSLGVFIMNWFLMMKYAFQIPYFIYVGKVQLFQVFYKDKSEVPGWLNHLYTLVVITVCFSVGIFNKQPVELLAICGGVFAYILSYVVPILVHLSCVYQHTCKTNLINNFRALAEEKQSLIQNIMNTNNVNEENVPIPPCESKMVKLKSQNKIVKYMFYYALLLIGLFNSYLIIKRIFDKKKPVHNLFF